MNTTSTIIPMPVPIWTDSKKEIKPFNWDINWMSFWPWFFIGAFLLTVIIGTIIILFIFKDELVFGSEWFVAILVCLLVFGTIGFLAFILPLLLAEINWIKTSINGEWLIKMRKIIDSKESWDDIFKKIDSFPLEIKSVIKAVQDVLNTGLPIH